MTDIDVATIVAAACSWPGVEARAAPAAEPAGVAEAGAGAPGAPGAPGAAGVLSADGRTFASVSGDGVELTLPPRVRDMLVETGRAAALPSAAHALVTADGDGAFDLDLLRLAYERARVTTAYRARDRPS